MKLRINVDQLSLGMYVTDLDRPWLESPFLFQGFEIQDDDELKQLRELCEYVFVDVERSAFDVAAHLRSLPLPPTRQHDETGHHDAGSDDATTDFRAELIRARRIYQDTRSYITQALDDVRLGSAVDTNAARRLVREMAQSVVRNHSALVWLTSLKERDIYTVTHCMNVCILALSFGRCLGLSDEQQAELGLGALLHDLGKMKVPDAILNKPSSLTPEEFEVMKRHPAYGYELLRDSNDVSDTALDIVLHHHERIDGMGYPSGLDGDAIRFLTKLVSIVDVYDAITSDRIYHDGIPPHNALKNMYNWAPQNFEQDLMEQFIRCIGIYPIGSTVELSNGQVGVVVSANRKSRLRPIVLLLMDEKHRPFKIRRYLNLAGSGAASDPQSTHVRGIVDGKALGINIHAIIEEESAG